MLTLDPDARRAPVGRPREAAIDGPAGLLRPVPLSTGRVSARRYHPTPKRERSSAVFQNGCVIMEPPDFAPPRKL
jgi:hypothetical protein